MVQRRWLKQNLKTTYSIISGRCSDAVRTRAKATDFKTTTSKYQDTYKLLKVTNQIMSCNDPVKFSPCALRNALQHFNTLEQSHTTMPNEYLNSFMNCVDIIIYSGGKIGLDPDMIRLAEAEIGVKYAKNAQTSKNQNACRCKSAISSYMLLSGGRQALMWQTHRKYREKLKRKRKPVSKDNMCSTQPIA